MIFTSSKSCEYEGVTVSATSLKVAFSWFEPYIENGEEFELLIRDEERVHNVKFKFSRGGKTAYASKKAWAEMGLKQPETGANGKVEYQVININPI